MVRKTKEEAQQTRALLLEAAQRLFSERGVSNTSLAEIAQAAGLTRGAVYWHFENKAELFAAIWEHEFLPLESMMEDLGLQYAEDPLGHVAQKARVFFERVAAQPQFVEIVLLKCEFVKEGLALRDLLVSCREECLGEVEEELLKAQQKGLIRADVEPRVAALGFFSLIDGCCFNWLLAPERYALQDFALPAVASYLQGLRS